MIKKRRNKGDDNQKNNKTQDIVNSMQLPIGMLDGMTHFELNGNREVIVDGCKGLLDYDENIVRVNMGKMITAFYGRNFIIKCLTEDSLIIEGFITSIEFTT